MRCLNGGWRDLAREVGSGAWSLTLRRLWRAMTLASLPGAGTTVLGQPAHAATGPLRITTVKSVS